MALEEGGYRVLRGGWEAEYLPNGGKQFYFVLLLFKISIFSFFKTHIFYGARGLGVVAPLCVLVPLVRMRIIISLPFYHESHIGGKRVELL